MAGETNEWIYLKNAMILAMAEAHGDKNIKQYLRQEFYPYFIPIESLGRYRGYNQWREEGDDWIRTIISG